MDKDFINFYNKRYKQGYMIEWPDKTKKRVYDIVKGLNLPKQGEALDFGCGNGVFTDVLKKALPNWDIYGVDISQVAIDNAKRRYKGCFFYNLDELVKSNKKFDFIFTHHVLEHVSSLSEVADQINSFSKDNSMMLHILPSANKGSFEYNICILIKDGIDRKRDNRFFFEDEGHLRRMSSKDVKRLFYPYNFNILKEYYSNNYYGAINWITKRDLKFIFQITNYRLSKNLYSKMVLLLYRMALVCIWFFRGGLLSPKFKHSLYGCVFKYIDEYIESKSEQEWIQNKAKTNGSSMYLIFSRNKNFKEVI